MSPYRPAGETDWPSWSWIALLSLWALDVAWLAIGDIGFDAASVRPAATLMVGSAVLLFLSRRIALGGRAGTLLLGLAFIAAAWPALRIFNHLTMTLAVPLADEMLAGWDAALGFHWPDYVLWADRQPLLLRAMSATYTSLTWYSCLIFLLLLLADHPAKARDFVLVFFVTALVVSATGCLFPAEAAGQFYGLRRGFENIPDDSGLYHLALLRELRENPFHVISLRQVPGLVTFPSFHTSMGVICIMATRGTPLFAAALVVNGLMIASTPIFGGHYLVDIIAGAGIAAIVAAGFERLARGTSDMRSGVEDEQRWGRPAQPDGAG